MLAGQSEKEEKTASPEVSIHTLTLNSNLGPENLEAFAVNSLRRRRTIIRSDACELENPPLYLEPQAHFVASSHKLHKSPKAIKYPKVTAAFPKIIPNNKIHPKELPKPKKVNPSLSKPPMAQPPVFFKCKVKKKLSPRESIDEEIENLNRVQKTTDLDIQLRRLQLQSFSMSSSSSDSERRPSLSSDNFGQSLTEYCNFDEKKVVKVTPHIRRKDVICDTVDAWSRGHEGHVNAELSRCKPLIFGGTYPIDLPFRGRNYENIQGGKYFPKTFQIDAPTCFESEEL